MMSDSPPPSVPTGSDSPELLSEALANRFQCVPVRRVGGVLEVAFATSPDDATLEELSFLTGLSVEPARRSPSETPGQPETTESDARPSPRDEEQPVHTEFPDRAEESRSTRSVGDVRFAGAAPHVVEHVLEAALAAGASDVHIEPYRQQVRVRFRLDGVLHTAGSIDPAQQTEVVSRIKIMADLDIAEKRRPQDGRITVHPQSPDLPPAVDLRISTLPTAQGEKVVLRVLDRSDVQLDLSVLGLEAEDQTCFEKTLRRPNGMILVTGPTGSGKTTTLYAALHALDREALNVQTIEDPIEYELAGVNQAQVKSDIGFGFAEALRAFLRQDPDVIMVGEIRDRTTAEIAIRAALTGHLVLSTLHTNDAPSTMGRLLDMGVPPYLVAASVQLVIAQRLVRRVCPDCQSTRAATPSEKQQLGLPALNRVVNGKGCRQCNDTGFRGRTAVFELLPTSEALAELVTQDAPTHRLRQWARDRGLRSLRAAAAAKVDAGLTTPDEALRQTV